MASSRSNRTQFAVAFLSHVIFLTFQITNAEKIIYKAYTSPKLDKPIPHHSLIYTLKPQDNVVPNLQKFLITDAVVINNEKFEDDLMANLQNNDKLDFNDKFDDGLMVTSQKIDKFNNKDELVVDSHKNDELKESDKFEDSLMVAVQNNDKLKDNDKLATIKSSLLSTLILDPAILDEAFKVGGVKDKSESDKSKEVDKFVAELKVDSGDLMGVKKMKEDEEMKSEEKSVDKIQEGKFSMKDLTENLKHDTEESVTENEEKEKDLNSEKKIDGEMLDKKKIDMKEDFFVGTEETKETQVEKQKNLQNTKEEKQESKEVEVSNEDKKESKESQEHAVSETIKNETMGVNSSGNLTRKERSLMEESLTSNGNSNALHSSLRIDKKQGDVNLVKSDGITVHAANSSSSGVPGPSVTGGVDNKNGFLEWLWSIAGISTTTPIPDLKPPITCEKCICGTTNKKNRIVGGQQTEVLQYPWMTVLLYSGQLYCGGALLNDRYVLTAAHCVNGFRVEKMSVRFLEHNRDVKDETQTIDRKISRIVKHAKYSSDNYNNDIALLRLDSTVPVTGALRPVCMPTPGKSFSGLPGIVTGWGAVEEHGAVSSYLQEVTVPIMSNKECRKTAYGEKRITDNMLCAGLPEGTKDSCQGDSGGPLHIINSSTNLHQIVGIVSWGEGCAQPDHPGVYTRVNRYTTWIRSNTADACYCQ